MRFRKLNRSFRRNLPNETCKVDAQQRAVSSRRASAVFETSAMVSRCGFHGFHCSRSSAGDGNVTSNHRLGGLLKSYQRSAALLNCGPASSGESTPFSERSLLREIHFRQLKCRTIRCLSHYLV